MLYSARYKKGLFWHKVKNITGDTILKDGISLPVRVLYLSDHRRLEIPMSCVIEFSADRFVSIQASMEKETGQKVVVN